MSVMEASVYVGSARFQFPAFSLVWRLCISSLCLKGSHVLKDTLQLGCCATCSGDLLNIAKNAGMVYCNGGTVG